MATMRDYSDRMGDVLKRWGTNPTAALPGPAEAPLPPIQPQAAPAADTIRATGPAMSKEAEAFQSQRASQMGPQRPAGWTPPNTAPSKMAQAFGTAEQWQDFTGKAQNAANSAFKGTGTLQPSGGAAATLGKFATGAAKRLGPIAGLYEAGTGVMEGDAGKVALGTADTAAALALATPAAPIAGTYLAGRGLYEGGKLAAGAISDSLGERGRDAVGGTVNGLLRRVGLGTNDDAMMELNAQAGQTPMRTAAPGPTAPTAPAAQAVAAPAGTSRFASNPNPFGAAPAAQAAPPAAQPDPFAGSISKTIRNPDGSAGKTTTVGTPDPLAHTLNDPGLKYVPIQLDDGTVLDGRTQARMAKQAEAQRAAEDKDPVARGIRQQMQIVDQVRARAEEMAGSNPDGRSGRIAAYMNQLMPRTDAVASNVALRGQDLDAEGKRATAATAAASAAATKAQQDRVFALDKQRFGVEVAEKNRVASAAAATAVQNSLEAKYRKTDKDGKSVPDHDKIADFRTAMDETLPAMIKELEATGNPAAQAKAKQLAERGAAALEPGDYDDLQNLFDFRDRAEKSAGVLPGSGDFKHSNNLLNYRQRAGAKGVQKTMIGGDRVVTPASNTSIRDFQYEDGPANALFPDWGKTQTLDLTRKLRGFQ